MKEYEKDEIIKELREEDKRLCNIIAEKCNMITEKEQKILCLLEVVKQQKKLIDVLHENIIKDEE